MYRDAYAWVKVNVMGSGQGTRAQSLFTGHTTDTHTQARHTERARFNALPHLVAMHPVDGKHQSPL